jgi:hypothetical protein
VGNSVQLLSLIDLLVLGARAASLRAAGRRGRKTDIRVQYRRLNLEPRRTLAPEQA